jgi:hypothetical protein
LFDLRRGKVSYHRVPMETAERVLALYRDTYFDLNMRHFHENLRDEHRIRLSYGWVKQALQGAPDWWRAARSADRIAGGGRGARCRACCCTSMAASTAG